MGWGNIPLCRGHITSHISYWEQVPELKRRKKGRKGVKFCAMPVRENTEIPLKDLEYKLCGMFKITAGIRRRVWRIS